MKLSGFLVASAAALLVLSSSPIRQAFAADDATSPRAADTADADLLLKMDQTDEGKAKVVELSQRLKMTAQGFLDFFKKQSADGQLTKDAAKSWAQLLTMTTVNPRTNPTAADYQNADVLSETVSAYMGLKSAKAADNMGLSASDLLEISQKWTITERSNFARTLRTAAQIANEGSAATSEDAFEKALGQLGYLDKYKSAACSL